MQMIANESPTRVEPLAARDEWEAFVHATPGATFFHRVGWKEVLEQSFGFRAHYLAARRDGDLVGVLPLCELRPPLGKPRLLSLPFAVEAGISAADDAARRALEDAAITHAQAIGARSLELRDGLGGDAFQVQADLYCRFRRSLSPCDAENFARIPRKQRRMIRLGQRSGLCARVDADIDVFYDLYARSQRRLGTPLLPRRYFEALRRHFAEASLILTVWHAKTAVAAVFSFLFGDRILPYYAGSREDYFRYAINDFMYWELMRLARQRGITIFDFGRSRRGSGAFHFKRHWGFEPEPLGYRIRSFGSGTAPRRTVDDPRVRILRWGWKRLPLALTTKIGPLFARHFAPYFT
jgi:FemAB-related protein (PEP-CTERM system-associated)